MHNSDASFIIFSFIHKSPLWTLASHQTIRMHVKQEHKPGHSLNLKKGLILLQESFFPSSYAKINLNLFTKSCAELSETQKKYHTSLKVYKLK